MSPALDVETLLAIVAGELSLLITCAGWFMSAMWQRATKLEGRVAALERGDSHREHR